MGVSLWLIPEEGAFKPLNELITHISYEEASPRFQPHITLVTLPSSSPIKIIDLLPPKESLPAAFPVIFNKVCAGRTFFQSVLVELQLKEGSELDELHKAVIERKKKLLPKEAETPPYYPHVSLYYGDVSPEAREAMIKQLIERGTITMVDGHPPISVAGVEGGFTVREIWIADCDGPVEGWKVLEKICLTG